MVLAVPRYQPLKKTPGRSALPMTWDTLVREGRYSFDGKVAIVSVLEDLISVAGLRALVGSKLQGEGNILAM